MKRFYIDLVTCDIIPESDYDRRMKLGAASSGLRYFGEYRTRQEAIRDLRLNCRYLIDRY